jgi:hypothetical protein
MCQEGQFVIENISYYDEAKLGTDLTAESDWKRRGLYMGPQVIVTFVIVMRRSDDYNFFSLTFV